MILVSVDGLLPAFYLDERWPAPAIQQIYREGAHAESVRSANGPEWVAGDWAFHRALYEPAGRPRQLATIEQLMSSAVESLEARARVHGRAKSNGRGPYASA